MNNDSHATATELPALISVVMPVYNGAATIAACLEALGKSDYPRFEVIVVDDGSRDHTLRIIRSFPCRVIEMAGKHGPAAARNTGAEAARGDLLFFLDSDITVTPTTLSAIAASFADRPHISALFCSYQKETIPKNFFSKYKNLIHHYTHQIAREDAITFCGGFGAIRRHIFQELGGFDPDHLFLEDIEFGYRMHQAGHKILLNKSIQLTHHKWYSFIGLIKSDLFGRAIPWTRIMLAKRTCRNDLNTRSHHVLSVAISWTLLVAPTAAFHLPASMVTAGMLFLGGLLLALNHHFLRFVGREKGMRFTFATIGMLWFTYVYSGLGLLLGIAGFLGDGLFSREPGTRGPTASHDSPFHYIRATISPGLRRPDA